MGMRIPEFIGRALIGAGRFVGRLRRALLQLVFGRPPASIIAYHGVGSTQVARLAARVIDDDGVTDPHPDDSAWTNARRMFRAFDARRVSGARLTVRCAGVCASTTVDDRGFARVELRQPLAVFPAEGAEAEWTLIDPLPETPEGLPDPQPPSARAPVHIPRATARFALVSDVDDTVIESRATSALRLAYETLSRNVYRRSVMPGMAAFYRTLTAHNHAPMVWLTSSIWRVHDLLRGFFALHGFPEGALLMSDARLLRSQWIADRHRTHKLGRLDDMRALWRLPMVLSGDCGQRDPEIFAAFAQQAPALVRAIYLRDLGDAARRAEVDRLMAPIRGGGIPVCVASDAVAFARHAQQHGLIPAGEVSGIARAAEEAAEAGGE